MGMGGFMMGNFLSTIAGVMVGSTIANAFLGDSGYRRGYAGGSAAGDDVEDVDTADAGDFGDGDADFGDAGRFGDFGGDFGDYGDFGGGDFGGDF